MTLGLDGPEVLRVTGQPVKNQPGEIRAPWDTNYHKIKADLCVRAQRKMCVYSTVCSLVSQAPSLLGPLCHIHSRLLWRGM